MIITPDFSLELLMNSDRNQCEQPPNIKTEISFKILALLIVSKCPDGEISHDFLPAR